MDLIFPAIVLSFLLCRRLPEDLSLALPQSLPGSVTVPIHATAADHEVPPHQASVTAPTRSLLLPSAATLEMQPEHVDPNWFAWKTTEENKQKKNNSTNLQTSANLQHGAREDFASPWLEADPSPGTHDLL